MGNRITCNINCWIPDKWLRLHQVNIISRNEQNLLTSLAYQELREIKRVYYNMGYKFQQSFYYYIHIKEKMKYRRIEVISRYPFTPSPIKYLHDLFSKKVAGFDYSLWSFDPWSFKVKIIHYVDRRDRE